MVRVAFTDDDITEATRVATRRHDEKMSRAGRLPASDAGRSLLGQIEQYIEGALCELVVARWLGDDVLADWRATRAFIPGGALTIPCDVGAAIQVRQTIWPGPGALLIRHKGEPADDKVFVLCVCRLRSRGRGRSVLPAMPDHLTLAGWAYAREIDTFDAADAGGGLNRAAWVRKAADLHPMSNLPPEAVRC